MKHFASAADGIDDIPFGVVSASAIAEAAGLEVGAVAVFKQVFFLKMIIDSTCKISTDLHSLYDIPLAMP